MLILYILLLKEENTLFKPSRCDSQWYLYVIIHPLAKYLVLMQRISFLTQLRLVLQERLMFQRVSSLFSCFSRHVLSFLIYQIESDLIRVLHINRLEICIYTEKLDISLQIVNSRILHITRIYVCSPTSMIYTRNIKLLLFLLCDNPRMETTSQVTCVAKQI